MRPNTRTRPQSHVDALALVLASVTCTLALWACFALALGLVPPYQYDPPCGEEGTDSWAECTYGEEMDMTPIIEDEAQTTTSQEREA